MRPVSLGDLTLLARVLIPIDSMDRMRIAQKILAEVEVEVEVAAQDLHKFGRVHPEFGDGSQMARCSSLSPIAEPFSDDQARLAAPIIGCGALRNHSKM